MSRPIVETAPLAASEFSGWEVFDASTGLTLTPPRHGEEAGDVYLGVLLGWLAKERPDWYLRLVSRRQISEAEAALASGALKASTEQRGKERALDEIKRESRYDHGNS